MKRPLEKDVDILQTSVKKIMTTFFIKKYNLDDSTDLFQMQLELEAEAEAVKPDASQSENSAENEPNQIAPSLSSQESKAIVLNSSQTANNYIENVSAPFEKLPEDIIAIINSMLTIAACYNLMSSSKHLWHLWLFPSPEYSFYMYRLLNKFVLEICENQEEVDFDEYIYIKNSIEDYSETIVKVFNSLTLSVSPDHNKPPSSNLDPNSAEVDSDDEFNKLDLIDLIQDCVERGLWQPLEMCWRDPMLMEFIIKRLDMDELFFLATLKGYSYISMLFRELGLAWTTTGDIKSHEFSTLSTLTTLPSDPLHNLVLSNPTGFKNLWASKSFQFGIELLLPPAVIAMLRNESLDTAFKKFKEVNFSSCEDILSFIYMTDQLGWNSLHWATALGDLSNLKQLIEIYNADIDKKTDFKESTSDLSPIHIACLQNNKYFIKYLADKGCRLDSESFDHPLHILAGCGYDDSLQALLDCERTDINITNVYNTTGLHLACLYDHVECVQVLLRNGIDYTICEEEFMDHDIPNSALDLADPKSACHQVLKAHIEACEHSQMSFGRHFKTMS